MDDYCSAGVWRPKFLKMDFRDQFFIDTTEHNFDTMNRSPRSLRRRAQGHSRVALAFYREVRI